MGNEIPAVVLGSGVNGLGVARSLARAKVPVWLLDDDHDRPEMHTRAARPLRMETLQGEGLVRELVRLGVSRFSGVRPVLFLTREECVRTVSRHRERLAPFYRFSLPPRPVVEALLHKNGFQALAERSGAPVPALVRVRSVSDLDALRTLRYPVVIKPGERHAEYARRFRKAYRVDGPRQALELLQTILPVMDDMVVQEWTEGPDSNLYFCLQYVDHHGRVAASFTGRKVRAWPPQVGGTASCVPAPEVAGELSRMTSRFFEGAGVVGMAGMEYKRDARRNTFRMVEPTIGRTDFQSELATLNGVNLPWVAYAVEQGLAVPVVKAATRTAAWRVRMQDRQSARLQKQHPEEGFEDVDTVRDALWRWSDPMPGLVRDFRRLRGALGRRAGRVMLRLQAAGGRP